MATTDYITITRRSRNISYGWTNQPVRVRTEDGNGYLAIAGPECPPWRGTIRQAIGERTQARKLNSGNSWAGAFFVDGRRVVTENTESAFEGFDALSAGDIDRCVVQVAE